jgi:iron complex transport system substrate-binding protein
MRFRFNRTLVRCSVHAALLAAAFAMPARAEAPQAARMVAIGGAVTEILYDLGLESRIVGIDTTSLYPASALKDKPNVGYMRALSAEGVLSLAPSLVLAIEGSGPPDALKQIGEAQVPLIMVPDEQTPAGVIAKIDTIGKIAGREEQAHKLAESVSQRFAALALDRARIGKRVRVLFVLSLQNGRAMAAGHKTAADSVIALAGGINAVGEMEGYKPLTDEAVIAAAPDVVLMMTRGDNAAEQDVFALPAFSGTPAAVHKAVIRMDGLYLLGFGPRTPDAARELMARLYPALALAPKP